MLARAPGRWGAAVCPHTAVGLHYREQHPDGDAAVVATAHPAKFEDVVEPLVGEPVPVPPSLACLLERPVRRRHIGPDLAELKDALSTG